ncbi:trigger factor [Peptostreptococcus anaerobius]|uniref:trigger factor n=1 Tax=Peptostreptococcus anaerobius TaxID=1261 RepID=UPI0028FE6631|nr:trigger factor [Peptostreptococcus anaerobius]MDU1599051.1 trigger factor [Peptostreptococcus anaerobius]MDU1682701.1 trigger factor [Peptostreptococcus anaerobius]
MKAELIKKEGNSVSFEMAVDAKEFDAAVEKAYKKTRSRYKIDGFRKGKAPRRIIEMNYGKGIFFNDALDILLPEIYPIAVDELGLKVVSQPELDIKEANEDGSLVLVATADVRPEVEVKNYKGVEIEKVSAEVEEERIDAELNSMLQSHARVVTVDAPVENGNTAVIDFKGLLNGEAFEGGTAEAYSLEIGSGTFIPGFEEQIIGKKAGEEFEVNVTFPEEYPAEELAGKPVVFEVKLHEVKVKELPELNDEFAQDTTEFESLAELKADVKAKLEKDAEEEAKRQMRDAAVAKVAEGVEVEIPNSMVEAQMDRMLNDLNMQLSYQGWSIEQFAELSGQSMEEIREARREDALNIVKSTLVVEEIAELENVEVSQEDLDKDLEKFAAMYQIDIEKVKKSLQPEDIENISNRIRSEKTVDLILDAAVVK